jgi:hypothetical protein
MSEDCLTIWSRLVEERLQSVGYQRGGDGDKQYVVARAAQRLGGPSRGDPADPREDQQQLLIRAPSQQAGDLFGSGLGSLGYCASDRNVGRGRPYCYWEMQRAL